jgi:hypothetical protein
MTQTMTRKFQLGQIVATPDAIERLAASGQTIFEVLVRHANCDWSGCQPEDAKANEQALKYGDRIFSVYRTGLNEVIWIITEGADENGSRESTCVLCPENY